MPLHLLSPKPVALDARSVREMTIGRGGAPMRYFEASSSTSVCSTITEFAMFQTYVGRGVAEYLKTLIRSYEFLCLGVEVKYGALAKYSEK